MKLVDYALQQQMEYLSDTKSSKYFEEYLQTVLEDTSKSYHQRADYVGLSLQELQAKIDSIGSYIKELQAYKKQLNTSLDMAKELTAKIFLNNGVDRIDGNIISSLTLSKSSIKTNTQISINNESEVMALGYVKFEPDIKAIEEAIQTKEGLKELGEYITVVTSKEEVPSKIKVNTKRSSNESSVISTDELLQLKQAS